jgi:hypothetical protein
MWEPRDRTLLMLLNLQDSQSNGLKENMECNIEKAHATHVETDLSVAILKQVQIHTHKKCGNCGRGKRFQLKALPPCFTTNEL